MAEPIENGAPNKKEFLISSCKKTMSSATDTDAVLAMLSHLPVFRCSDGQ